MTIKFCFLLHLTCFLVVCSHRGFDLFGIFHRLFILAKSSSNSPQRDVDNVLTFPPYYCPGTTGFPVWYTCTYLSQVLKIHHHTTTSMLYGLPSCSQLATLRAFLSVAFQSLQLCQGEGLGTWRQRARSWQGKKPSPPL